MLKDKKHLRKVQPKSDTVLQNVLSDAETAHIIQGCYPQKTFFDNDADGECKTEEEKQAALTEYEGEGTFTHFSCLHIIDGLIDLIDCLFHY